MSGHRRRLPRRGVDRLSDLLTWLTAAAAIAAVVATAVVATAAYHSVRERAALEAATRTAVTAVTTERTSPPLAPGVARMPTRVRYTGADGTAHEAMAPVLGLLPAGAPVTVWLAPDGSVADPPTQAGDAAPSAVTVGVLLLLGGGALLALVYLLASEALLRVAGAGWEREWRAIEPGWSGRAGGRTG
jgi:hypothetical protein